MNSTSTPDLSGLSLMERSVWMLAEYEGFDADTIGAITGQDAEAARQTLSAARAKMAPLKPVAVRWIWLPRVAAAAAAIALLLYGIRMSYGPTLPQENSLATAPAQSDNQTRQTTITPEPASAPVVLAPRTERLAKTTPVQPQQTPQPIPAPTLPQLPARETPDVAVQTAPSPAPSQALPALNTLPAPTPDAVIPANSGAIAEVPIDLTVPVEPTAIKPNSFSRLRKALTPRSYSNADGRLSVALELPSLSALPRVSR